MAQCFSLLRAAPGISQYEGLPMQEVLRLITGRDIIKCSECENGKLISVHTVKAVPEDT
jgi:hypothetical protein